MTAHSGIDYDRLVELAQLVVDFRNATGKNGSANGCVWKPEELGLAGLGYWGLNFLGNLDDLCGASHGSATSS